MNRAVRPFAMLIAALCALLLLAAPAWAEEVAQPALTLNFDTVEIDLAVSSRGGTLTPSVSPAQARPRSRSSFSNLRQPTFTGFGSGMGTGSQMGTDPAAGGSYQTSMPQFTMPNLNQNSFTSKVPKSNVQPREIQVPEFLRRG